MSFTFNRTNNKIIKKTVSLATNPTINTNVFEETYQIISATNSTITLPNTSNANSNYYNNWYIKILSGLGINQIRQIQSYNSSIKQITLKTNLDIIPSSSDSIILYNKLNSNIIWQESNNRFAPVYMKNSTNLNQMGETIEYLDFGCNNLTILSNKQSHSTTSGSLIVNGGSGITGSVNIGNSLNVTNNIACNSLSVNGISITGNLSNSYLTDITPGTAYASKVLILNSSKDITGINSLTTTNLVTTNITLNGTAIIANATEINKLSGTTAITSDFNKLASITASATKLNYNDITTIGTAEASKALIIDSNKDIQSIRRLHLNNISIGTLDYTNTNRLISAIDNSITNSTARYLCLGKSYTTYNEAEWGYFHTSDGSTSNRQEFGFYGANGIFAITAGRKVGINNTGPNYDLDVTGDINLTGSIRFSGTAITATATELNYNDITTIGIAEASKALILDSSRNITNINSLTTTNLTSSGNIVSSNANASFRILPYTDNIVYLQAGLNTTTGSSADIFIGNYIQTASASSRKIMIKADGKVGFGTASPSYTLDVIGDINLTGSLRFSGIAITASATELNKLSGTTAITSDFNKLASITASATELNYLDFTTGSPGIAEASKSLVLNSTLDITGINSLTTTTLITTNLTLNGTLITASATELNYNDITTIGTAEASKALILDSSRNISNINSISLNGFNDVITLTNSGSGNRTSLRFINDARSWELGSRGSTISNPNLFYLYDNTASAYRLTINSSGNVNIVNHNGSSTGLQLNGILITATATELNILDGVTATSAELNYLDITSAGIAQASKALIVDANKDITSIRNLTATNLTGTLQTSNQTNITSVGTLTSLSTGNITLNGTLITATAAELNILDGVTATAAELNTLDITSAGTAQASKALVLDSSRNINNINNLSLTGTLTIGTVGSGPNRINFSGTTSDASSNHTVIAERIYGGTEQSELLIFKGNDPITASGPDRIRLRASEFRFQTYTSSEDFSGLNDNNDRIFITNEGYIGFNGAQETIYLPASYNTYTMRPSSGGLSVSLGFISSTNKASYILQSSIAQQLFIGTQGTYNTQLSINSLGDSSSAELGNGLCIDVKKPNTSYSSLLRINNDTHNIITDLQCNNSSVSWGTYTNHPFALMTNNANRLVISSSGYVGIGTSGPSYPLHVSGGASYTGTFIFYARSGSNSNIGTATNNSDTSIYASGRVTAGEFNAFSDSRIKKNITNINDISALNTLRLIEPKQYNYIDTLNKTNQPVWGFLAQQVSEVLDYSVSLITDYIPNIFQLANKSLLENGDNILSFTNLINYDLNGTGKVKLIDTNDKTIYVTIKNKINNTSFSVNELLENEEYFIYGEEVSNYHSLNKDSIFTITTAAVQEIDRIVIEQKNKIENLENENQLLKDQIQNILERLQLLENN